MKLAGLRFGMWCLYSGCKAERAGPEKEITRHAFYIFFKARFGDTKVETPSDQAEITTSHPL